MRTRFILPKPVSLNKVILGSDKMHMSSSPESAIRTAKRVTISDMAEALGVTKSTVSRAMNGYPDISDAMQLRVKHLAAKLGYQPLSHAQAIKTGRTRSLGIVLQFSDHDGQRPFLAEYLAGVSAGANVHGWTLTVSASSDDAELMDTFRALIRDRKADGFILPRALMDDPRVHLLRDAKVPFVLFGRPKDDSECAWFDILGENAMRDAVQHLASLGHRRIGFINGGMHYAYAALRDQGFAQGMALAGLDIDPDLILENALTVDAGAAAAAAMLDRSDPPTAIVCAVDFAALGVYRAAADRGLQVGRDVSIVSYDGIPEGAYAKPPLSTFSVDTRAAGSRLANLLIRRIQGEPAEQLRETASATFIDRGSIGPPV
jgi:LacI family transcriptional regulator